MQTTSPLLKKGNFNYFWRPQDSTNPDIKTFFTFKLHSSNYPFTFSHPHPNTLSPLHTEESDYTSFNSVSILPMASCQMKFAKRWRKPPWSCPCAQPVPMTVPVLRRRDVRWGLSADPALDFKDPVGLALVFLMKADLYEVLLSGPQLQTSLGLENFPTCAMQTHSCF